MPRSHCPWKFLSPSSKRKRSRNVCHQRTRLQKQAVRFYKKSKAELPANQSNELCQLIQAVESSEEGKAELGKIIGDGNKFEGKNAVTAGDCIEEVWKWDREGFFKDQRNSSKDWKLYSDILVHTFNVVSFFGWFSVFVCPLIQEPTELLLMHASFTVFKFKLIAFRCIIQHPLFI